jgi:hypothetical protein
LIRRRLLDGELAYFTTWCPQGTSMDALVRVEGARWRIEEGFETANNELGLDHNESRSWHGWHRPVSLVMLAYAVMGVVRHLAHAVLPPKTPTANSAKLIRWSVQEIRRLALKLAQRRIPATHMLAWSVFRRAHQATARQSHLPRKMQL